ncbi:MAG: Na+/H+ antiporter subunit E [Candidatus Azotimanducaceae bacterium]
MGRDLKVLPRYPLYLFWLAREVVLSNILLAKIILAPKILLHRQIIYTKTYQSSDLAKTLYANSVTLTPGTLTIDIAEEGFLVHSLAKAFTDDIRSNKMNLRVAKLEPWIVEMMQNDVCCSYNGYPFGDRSYASARFRRSDICR